MVKEINISQKGPKEEDPTKPEISSEEIPQKVVESEKPKEKKNKKVLILIISGVVLLLVIASFFYFGIYRVKPYKKPSEIINLNSEYLISNKDIHSFVKMPVVSLQEPRTEVSPINGLLFTKTEMDKLKTKRPVAVMINNHQEARPQSGLNSADIVYETLAESGITRYLAIFWSQAPAKVGPIRSARQYYLEWLSPYDPLFIYDGCAETDNPKTDACGNVYTYAIKKLATIGAWRWNDGRRFAPHNEYSSVNNAWEYAEKMNWDTMPTIEAWKFKNEAPVNERGEKTKVSIIFHQRLSNGNLYDVVWAYDPKSNSYFKQTGNQADLDQETNTRVYAKNLVIQRIIMTPANDDKGRIVQETIGEGKAVFCIDGKITEGTWKKNNRMDRTTYYNNQGNEVQFNRGRIWISAVSQNEGKFAIIEQ